MPGGVGGLHTLRLGKPFGDCYLVAILCASASESRILKEELNDLTKARSRPRRVSVNIAAGESSKPRPSAAERTRGARVNVFNGPFPCKQAPREDADQGRIGHI
jgi:hypothetical protein